MWNYLSDIVEVSRKQSTTMSYWLTKETGKGIKLKDVYQFYEVFVSHLIWGKYLQGFTILRFFFFFAIYLILCFYFIEEICIVEPIKASTTYRVVKSSDWSQVVNEFIIELIVRKESKFDFWVKQFLVKLACLVAELRILDILSLGIKGLTSRASHEMYQSIKMCRLGKKSLLLWHCNF